MFSDFAYCIQACCMHELIERPEGTDIVINDLVVCGTGHTDDKVTAVHEKI